MGYLALGTIIPLLESFLFFTTCVYNTTFLGLLSVVSPLLKLFGLYTSTLLFLLAMIDMINKASLLSFHKMK